MIEPGYWTILDLAAHLQVSRWTAQRRVKADPAFPVLRGWGPDRFPIDRVKAYLPRLEPGLDALLPRNLSERRAA